MRCPVCDSDNLDDSAECVSCGKAFPSRAEDGRAAAALEELEMTQVAPPEAPVRVEPLAGLEHTRLPADRAAQSQWTAEAMPLERTQHEVDAEAQGAWEGEIEVDPGREPDSGERTALPAEAPQRASEEGSVTCPACFARVAREVRCSDCGMPFPLQEL